MLFRRASVRYGRTPEPETPYQKAAQVWDERAEPMARHVPVRELTGFILHLLRLATRTLISLFG